VTGVAKAACLSLVVAVLASACAEARMRVRHRATAPRAAVGERCGPPDTLARTIPFETSDGVTLEGATVGSGPVGAVPIHEYPGPMRGWYAAYLARHSVRARLFDLRCFSN
jgi:hypothetical protein